MTKHWLLLNKLSYIGRNYRTLSFLEDKGVIAWKIWEMGREEYERGHNGA